MRFDQQRYLRDLLDFCQLRLVDDNGESLDERQLSAAFHQPFRILTENDHREVAEEPVPQVRVAIEVLRRRLGDMPNPDEHRYRHAALDSLLGIWGISRDELTTASLDDSSNEEDHGADATELIASVAARLGITSDRVNELLSSVDEPSEEALETIFGLPSTRRYPNDSTEDFPKLLVWQYEQLPDDTTPTEQDDAIERSVRQQSEQSLERTLSTARATAEAEALPILRDILVGAVADQVHPAEQHGKIDDAANHLTRLLAIDFANSGQVMTTRVAQATETLQSLVFGLRTGMFAPHRQRQGLMSNHPAQKWRITFDDDYTPSDFETDWHWLSRYEMWRSAAQSLVHPEAMLLPSLLDGESPQPPSLAFRTLINRLQATAQLTPSQARRLVNGSPGDREELGYLAMLRDQFRDEVDEDFVMTDQLNDAQLEQRRAEIETHFKAHDLVVDHNADEQSERGSALNWLHRAPAWLKEMYYFVPLTLAQHLQRSGHFLAALAWYRTIYAYDREPEQRKIFYGLVFEEHLPLVVLRNPTDWLRHGLNPHEIAGLRGYAYTRFTLQSIISCLLDFADAEFTAAGPSALARARSLYLTALELLELPEMLPLTDERAVGYPQSGVGPAPAVTALRQHAQLSLDKLRDGRNIAGLYQPQGLRHRSRSAAPLQRSVAARPTIYRYQVLVERAKHLVGIAQQIEASFLSSAERADTEAYNLLQARQDLALSQEQVDLHEQREHEAAIQIQVAAAQRQRAGVLRDSYQEMIDAGLNDYERDMIASYQRSGAAQKAAADAQALSQVTGSVGSWLSTVASIGAGAVSSNPGAIIFGLAGAYTNLTASAIGASASNHQKEGIEATVSGQVSRIHADFARRKQEWRRQKALADKDLAIGDAQIERALKQHQIAAHERDIAQLRTEYAAVTLDFLANKFTNAELYEWMSDVLNRIYRFFLQQATTTALLAQDQLAFERQEKLPGFIQHDYWRPPTEGLTATGNDLAERDRRGLTGSARLLQDIVKLDQFAFQTRTRQLELSQTFSLAQLFPYEFEQFRRTGQLPFVTPMELFDRGFPGHYLRLIKQVSVSVLALVPPTAGVRATLTNSGVSRVVIGPDVFQTVEVQRSPEQIAFTAPIVATGLFGLKPEGELLLPFEGQGVDTTWLLEMPRAANRFDYRTLADVIVTVDYTAQHSDSYRRQVISHLDRTVQAERPIHVRHELVHQWYDLHNPDPGAESLTLRFETQPSDFPPNLDELLVEDLLLCFMGVPGTEPEMPIESLRFTDANGKTFEAGNARTRNGVISTQGSNGRNWAMMLTQVGTPFGTWELDLPNIEEVRRYFAAQQIEDILFVISFSGQTPAWPS